MYIKNAIFASWLIMQSCKRADKFRPEPENISSNPARTRKLIWSTNHARKKNESWVRSKKFSNIAKLFWLFFVHLRQKVRLRPELSPKLFSTLGPNPAQTRTQSEKPGPTYNSVFMAPLALWERNHQSSSCYSSIQCAGEWQPTF